VKADTGGGMHVEMPGGGAIEGRYAGGSSAERDTGG